MTITMTDVESDVRTSTGDSDVTHIVMSYDPTLTPQAYVFKARVEGIPLVALCGFIWMPSKDATKLPVCEPCREIYESKDRTDAFGNSGLPEAA